MPTKTTQKARPAISPDAKTGYAAPEPAQAGEFAKLRVALLATRWNVEIVDALLRGARECLKDWGVQEKRIDVLRVPGAYEMPLACMTAAHSRRRYDGIVTLGAVIRGDTPHFDFVAGECARGLIEVQLKTGAPIGFGVLTVNTVAQAVERAGPGPANKGYEATAAMLEMIRLQRELK